MVVFILFKKQLKRMVPIKEGEAIIDHVKDFWDEKIQERYKKYGMLHKTGVVMYGPPGSGKTSIINSLIKNLVTVQKGLVFSIEDDQDVSLYSEFMGQLRQIEPNRPIITIIEDCDGLLDGGRNVEKMLLNILDGINQIEHVAYIATTNYPERMQARLINRPGRFDRRFKIGYPDAVCRKAFFEFKFLDNDLEEYDLQKIVKDTEGLTISHCKELFIEYVVKGRDFEEVVKELKEMDETKLSSTDDRGKKKAIGFNEGYDKSSNDRFEEAFGIKEALKEIATRVSRRNK
jgi:SpoVK/Ycf46/Vps4 family AAA+-type ATPase